MKLIFITYEYNEEYSKTGIGKKIDSQFNALKSFFEETYISGGNENYYYIHGTEYKVKYSNNFQKRIQRLELLKKFIIEKKITYVYLRYAHFADSKFTKFLEEISKFCVIIVEIPTYPYDSEYKFGFNKRYLSFIIEKKHRNKMEKYIDYIVTFSEDEKIFGVPCINISNGINLEKLNIVKKIKATENTIRFTSISSCDYWHGIDRFLNSMENYLEKNPTSKVKFNIVGEGREIANLKKIVSDSSRLSESVIFQGFKSGKELDEIYNETDIGIGCLGNHRKGIYTIQALKNKEYAAKGLPMIFSEDDPGLRGREYVYRATHDEYLIDIADLIQWYQKLTITPEEIRESVKEFSWENQMKKVIDKINELDKKGE